MLLLRLLDAITRGLAEVPVDGEDQGYGEAVRGIVEVIAEWVKEDCGRRIDRKGWQIIREVSEGGRKLRFRAAGLR